MASILKLDRHIRLYERFASLFSDTSFSEMIVEKLQQAIIDCDNLTLSTSIVKKFCHRYFHPSEFANKAEFKQVELIFKTLCVFIVSTEQRATSTFFRTTDELLREYPDFCLATTKEIKDLLLFRNMVKAALLVVEARLNKQLIIDIVARFEGNFNKYITGTGQSLAVTRRVAIYEQEGNIVPEKRPYRSKASPETSPTTNKRKMLPSSAPAESPSEVERQVKRRRAKEPISGSVIHPAVPTSSSAPQYVPNLAAAQAPWVNDDAHAPLPSDDDFLTLLADLPFDGEHFECDLPFIQEVPVDCAVPMIRTPCLPPLDSSSFLKDTLRAALEKGFYDGSYTASSAATHTVNAFVEDVQSMFDCVSFDEVFQLSDLGFSFASDFCLSGM